MFVPPSSSAAGGGCTAAGPEEGQRSSCSVRPCSTHAAHRARPGSASTCPGRQEPGGQEPALTGQREAQHIELVQRAARLHTKQAPPILLQQRLLAGRHGGCVWMCGCAMWVQGGGAWDEWHIQRWQRPASSPCARPHTVPTGPISAAAAARLHVFSGVVGSVAEQALLLVQHRVQNDVAQVGGAHLVDLRIPAGTSWLAGQASSQLGSAAVGAAIRGWFWCIRGSARHARQQEACKVD